jgi:ParB/RepB/Spo0J family partition protein
MATTKRTATQEVNAAAAAPAAKTKGPAKKAAPKKATPKAANQTFGKETLVRVANMDDEYYGLSGRTTTSLPDKDGLYVLETDSDEPDLKFLAVHANDLELVEDDAPKATGAAAQFPVEEVAIDQITADTEQPRRHFSEAEMEELTSSIRQYGVLQPIVLRKNPYLVSSDTYPYCIVFGERRWRAAKAAGLNTIPASIRVLTEVQALELQVIENLQRKDVHPMEEGIAFKKLMDGGVDIEGLRLKIGVSNKYIATRIKLNDLTEQWQKAYLTDRIDLSQAVKLSKLDSKKQNMLYRDSSKDRGSEIHLSTYTLDNVVKNASHSLDKAPFKTEDPNLNPEMGKCSSCPFNTSNTPRLFMGDERLCTNSACYGIKEKNNYKKKLEKAAKEPDILFLDNSYWKSEEDKVKVAAAKDMGVQFVTRDEIISNIQDPGPMPVFEEWVKDYTDPDEALSNEDLQYLKNDFKDELEQWEENKKIFDRAQTEGAMRRAFVVVGNNAGKYVSVMLRSENPHMDDEDGSNPIAEIEKREARSKELDNEKVYKRVTPLLKDLEAYHNSTAPLSKEEQAALVVFLIDSASYIDRGWLEEQLGAKNHWDADMYNKVLNEMLPGTYNQFVRRILFSRLISVNESDFGAKSKPAAIMGIARQYLPTQVKEIELQQQEKALKRQKNVEKKIAALKAGKEKEVTDES